MRIAVASQTPLVRFKTDVQLQPHGRTLDLATLTRGEDWSYTAGGVTRMLKPLLQAWAASGFTRDAEWVALQGRPTPPVAFDGFRASFVHLDDDERAQYVKVKEGLWALLNGLPKAPDSPAELPQDTWDGFRAYSRATARRLLLAERRLELRARPFHVAYVHDFQLLPLGRELRVDAPRLFHLHTPFPRDLSSEWADWFADAFSHYEAIIVSSRAYADAVRATGFDGALHVVHPFVDPQGYPEPSAEAVEAFRRTHGIGADDHVILNVARMDPMKSQDRLIRALPRVLQDEPDARLVLVGNGSFSSSSNGGLGLSKGARWRRHLEGLARELGVEERVTFTGHVSESEMTAAYRVAHAFALPSVREGFGLAAVEAWLYGVPVVVSDGAGVRELVVDGENGFVVDSADEKATARALAELLDLTPDRREAFADSGREAARAATQPHGRARLERILLEVAPVPSTSPRDKQPEIRRS